MQQNNLLLLPRRRVAYQLELDIYYVEQQDSDGTWKRLIQKNFKRQESALAALGRIYEKESKEL